MEDSVLYRLGEFGLRGLRIEKGEKIKINFRIKPVNVDLFKSEASKAIQRAFIKGSGISGVMHTARESVIKIEGAEAKVLHGEGETHVQIEGTEKGITEMIKLLERVLKSSQGK